MSQNEAEKTMQSLRDFGGYYQGQLDILRQLTMAALPLKNGERLNGIYPLLDSINTSGYSTDMLIRSGLITEAFILARAFLERLVNACYLLVCDRSAFDDYIEFSMQKVQRSFDTRRTAYEAIGKEVPGVDVSSIPVVARGLEKFTSQRGKEITRWTTLNIERRIEYIKERNETFKAGLFLAVTRYIYEDASEAVHGTLYGALFHTGIFVGAHNPEIGEKYLNSTRRVLYMLLGLLVDGLVQVASKEVETEMLKTHSTNNFKTLQQYFEKKTET